jgi:hypothetical protein
MARSKKSSVDRRGFLKRAATAGAVALAAPASQRFPGPARAHHNRGIDRARIGTTIDDPNIDFAKLAQGLGLHAEGPISDPKDLGPAIRRAIAAVKRGEPALVDVVTQPR